ncbi:MAG TPA: anthranilate phosphoribosyltransferase [bacterium]|nr:anthranilate phosphoribosyltransferase [bacterium]
MDIRTAIRKTVNGEALSHQEAYSAASEMMSGAATDAQIAALLMAMKMKGESVEEISGFAHVMRDHALKVVCASDRVVDTCGTGGDHTNTFNVSTLSALVAAGAGCPVAKHGNRSVSSRCGSADLFEALGVSIKSTPETAARSIDQTGIGFLFAPAHHAAMKYVIGPRKEMGIRTIFNILGPLTNPAGARRQLVGVYDRSLTEIMASVLREMGSEHVMAVHGEDGMDEITITGKTFVTELKDGTIERYTVQPEDFGFRRADMEDIQGGDPERNAQIAVGVLQGRPGPHRDMVLLNAGAVIYIGGKAETMARGIQEARHSIDAGLAFEVLDRMKQMSGRRKAV